MNIWVLILTLAAWTYVLRLAGPFLLKRTTVPEGATRVLNNIAPGVLSALIVTGMFASGRSLVLDERAIGFVAAALAVMAKLPPLVVIVAVAAATAAARALTG
jgi:branched-subunit amino acid transport protein